MNKNARIVAAAAVLAVQLLAIGWLIFRYERIVSDGTECRFACRGYDPYDPFRGRYLRLSASAECDPIPDVEPYNLDEVWMKIDPKGGTNSLSRIVAAAKAPEGEGTWVRFPRGSVHRAYRVGWSDRRKDEEYEDFQKRQKESGHVYRVNLPDRFFMNEKLAPKAETVLAERASDAIAVYRVKDGEIVLVDVEIGGRPISELVR